MTPQTSFPEVNITQTWSDDKDEDDVIFIFICRKRDGFSTERLQLRRRRFRWEEEGSQRGGNNDDPLWRWRWLFFFMLEMLDELYHHDHWSLPWWFNNNENDFQGSHSHLEFLLGENGSDDEFYDCPEVRMWFWLLNCKTITTLGILLYWCRW